MAESQSAAPPILIPTTSHPAFHPPSPPEPSSEIRFPKEAKVFLIPKHDSYPLSLQLKDNPRRFPAQFEPYPLGSLFTPKALTEEEIAIFSTDK